MGHSVPTLNWEYRVAHAPEWPVRVLDVPVARTSLPRGGTFMRFLLLLLPILLLACNPAEGFTTQNVISEMPLSQSPTVTPIPTPTLVPTPTPDPRIAGLEAQIDALRLALPGPVIDTSLTEAECIVLVRPYYTDFQWEHSIDFAEQGCSDEQFYQQLPLQTRLILLRVAFLQEIHRTRIADVSYHCHWVPGNDGLSQRVC